MKIVDVITSAGLTGFYFDDQRAIKLGAPYNGFTYIGKPVTPGFSSIRQKGESISIMFLLEDGQIAYGDCAAVQYSGVGGRDPLFLAQDYIPLIQQELASKLRGRVLTSFRELATEFDHLKQSNGQRLHTAIRYGLTQALLDGVAKAKHKTMTEVVCEEYGLPLTAKPVPIFAQTGDERYSNGDKAILKHVQVLPHGLINNVETKLGSQGEILLDYVKWLKKRIEAIGGKDYRPVLHLDVYGTLGIAFKDDFFAIANYLKTLSEAAYPFKLRIEGPVDAGSREAQIQALGKLHNRLQAQNIPVEIVADEWCNTLEDIQEFVQAGVCDMVQIKTPDLGGINNTIEAVLFCKEYGIGAYMGGTCNETERSAQISVHIAVATQPAQILAKPGMGLDEGVMIVYNEMQRVLAILENKKAKEGVPVGGN
jgi:methylaspartate ammonia-lyase